MHAVDNSLSSRALAELEMRLSQELKQRAEEAFGDQGIIACKGDGIYEQIDPVIREIIKPFPQTPAGSRFINAKITVIPVLYIKLSQFHPLLQEVVPGNMFLDEVGLAVDVGPLADPEIFGEYSFTPSNSRLKVQNIRLKPGSTLRPNEYANQAPLPDDRIAINSGKVEGDISRDAALKKTEFIADVTFGEWFHQKDLEIPVETWGTQKTTYLAIPLRSLSFTRKIYPDGTFHLPNREKCSVETLKGRSVVFLNCNYTFEERFPL